MHTLTVDVDLMVAAGLLPLQAVQLVNRRSGRRWDVMVLPGESGGGEVTPNLGAGSEVPADADLAVWSWQHMDYVLAVAA